MALKGAAGGVALCHGVGVMSSVAFSKELAFLADEGQTGQMRVEVRTDGKQI